MDCVIQHTRISLPPENDGAVLHHRTPNLLAGARALEPSHA